MPQHTVDVSFTTLFKIIFTILVAWWLFLLRDLLMVLLTAVVTASAIEPGAQWLVRRRIPRVLAVIVIYLVGALLFASIFVFLIPTLVNELSGLSNQLPSYIETLSRFNENSTDGLFGISVGSVLDVRDVIDQVVRKIQDFSGSTESLVRVVSKIFGGALSFVMIVVISFYLAVQENGIQNFLKIIVPLRYEKYTLSLWQRSQVKIGQWFRGQLLLGVFVGILVYLALMVFQVPYAFLLAVIAGVFELIPIFGPILSVIPAVILAFVAAGPAKVLVVLLIYFVVQQFENQLLYPLVVRQVVGVPPIISIIALVAGGILGGFLGMLLSIPLAAVVMEILGDFDKEKHHYRYST